MEHFQGLFEPDRDAGGYVVTLPDFGYGVTQGETEDEAVEMARDLLTLTIEDYVRAAKPLPVAARRRGSKYRSIDLTALQSAKVDLYRAFASSGVAKAAFGRRMGLPAARVDRLFSLQCRSRLEEIEAGLAVLGKRLHVETRDAA